MGKKWLFIGPNLLSGIGQVTKRYANLVGGDYIEIDKLPRTQTYDNGFAFVLPIETHLAMVDKHMASCAKKMYMTVCETETVHPVYEILVRRYKTLYVPSEFCRTVFSRQFPQGDWRLLRHTATPDPLPAPKTTEYTFYTIGNMADPRKNIRMLLEAFIRLGLPGTRLVLKATCMRPYECRIPNVTVINGLVSDEELLDIHRTSHCYVNCSYSEGVGMGAVEAAMHDRPVIITEYGGLKEYIPSTPFVVGCDRCPVGQDDFLYTKDMIWGSPRLSELIEHMRTCALQRIDTWNHELSRKLVSDVGPFFSSQ